MKRLLYIIGIIAGIALIIGGGYYLRYQTAPKVAEIDPLGGMAGQNLPINNNRPGVAATTSVGIPQIQAFGAISPDPVAAYHIDPQESALLLKTDGQVVRMTKSQTEVLSAAKIEGIVRASFSSNGHRLLVKTGAGKDARHSIFEIDTKTWQAVPANFQEAAWSPIDDRIAYTTPEGELVVWNIADPKAKPQALTRIPWVGVALTWPSEDLLVIHTRPSVHTNASAFSYSIKSGLFTTLFEDVPGGHAIWSGDGSRGILFRSNANDRGGRLSLLDGKGAVVRELNLVTLPDKCIFHTEPSAQLPTSTTPRISTSTATSTPNQRQPDRNYLMCGMPRYADAISQAELPDDYYQQSLFTEDELIAIDLRSGNILSIFNDPAESVDAERLRMASGKLYFINRLDGRLYAARAAGL